MTDLLQEYTTQTQAAKRLGVNKMFITRLIRSYNIPVQDFGRVHLVRFADVKAAFEKHGKQKAEAEIA